MQDGRKSRDKIRRATTNPPALILLKDSTILILFRQNTHINILNRKLLERPVNKMN